MFDISGGIDPRKPSMKLRIVSRQAHEEEFHRWITMKAWLEGRNTFRVSTPSIWLDMKAWIPGFSKAIPSVAEKWGDGGKCLFGSLPTIRDSC